MYNASFLKKTGQIWKLVLSGAGAVFCLILMILGVYQATGVIEVIQDETGGTSLLLLLVAPLLGIAFSLFGIMSIKCPNCRTKLYGRALKGLDLHELSQCPVCGYSGPEEN